jgi:hypothetical protein
MDSRVAALELVAAVIPAMVASLDHADVASPGWSLGGAGLAGRKPIMHMVASGGNLRSSDQSMMASARHFLHEGIG